MADREIVREVQTSDSGAMTLIVTLLVLFLIGLGIWAFASGKMGNMNPTPTPNDINIKVDAPKVDIPKMPDVNVTVPNVAPTPAQ